MRHPLIRRVAALALPLLAACGESTGPDASRLSEAEARALATALTDGPAAPAQALGLLVGGADSARATIPCPAGGEIAVQRSGSHTVDASGTGTVTFSVVQVQRGCTVRVRGESYVIDGDPSVTVSGTLRLSNRLPVDASVRESGAFRWSVGGRTGRCATDVTRTLTFSPTPSGTVEGTICGVTVNRAAAR